jgi:A/G-specific adenine glycosylase
MKLDFTGSLLFWYKNNKRPFPWREKVDPYSSWISEVMSQQTTMAVVLPRFEIFLKSLPTLKAFYEKIILTGDDTLLRQLWQGLGYYARARNLSKGVCYVMTEGKGVCPASYEDWLKVPGVGPYTASVLSSVHGGERKACVDGNVIRVVSRYFALEKTEDVWSAEGQRHIAIFAQRWMDALELKGSPGDLNQALMELGSTVCTKQKPKCGNCPVQLGCAAHLHSKQDVCPPTKPRAVKKKIELEVVAIEMWNSKSDEPEVLLIQRAAGFLKKTQGFPLIGSKVPWPAEANVAAAKVPAGKHTITHHEIELKLQRVTLSAESRKIDSGGFEDWCAAHQGKFYTLSELRKHLTSSLDLKILKALQKVAKLPLGAFVETPSKV